MTKICAVTATRAEFGLLQPVLKKILQIPDFELKIVATGMHLSPEFGLTYKEIEDANLPIDRKIEIQLSSNSTEAIPKTMGIAMISFADYFSECKPDFLMIFGDRYEMLAVASTAMCMQIPIIHISGGETTEGAIDEAIRHSITKMSCMHFAATEAYRKRIIQLGEHPDRVFNVGGLGVENIKTFSLLTRQELEQSLDIHLNDKYVLVTFHPVTLEKNSAEKQTLELIRACENYPLLQFIFTKANSDASGQAINNILNDYTKQNSNMLIFDSLGTQRYLSAVKHASFVLGNSSSGIMEVPSFGIPTVNIGDRQRGRMRAKSIIDCKPTKESIIYAINHALDEDFRNYCKTCKNPYEGEDPSGNIVKTIQKLIKDHAVDIKKTFYNITF